MGDGGGARRVAFPPEGRLVTSYLDPPQPFHRAEELCAETLLAEYKESCLKHRTVPLESVLIQIGEKGTLGGCTRRGLLNLAGNDLTPSACEALESIFRKTRFQRIDVHDCNLNDEAAIALFDMIEYYESTVELDISGNKGFGILAWQACSKMINKCQWLEQLEIRETSLNQSSAPVLGRGLRPLCSLRCLHLEQSHLSGPPLLCLAGVMKQNKSVRELHLGDNNLVPSDAKILASMLKINTSLQLLDVSNNDIQDSGIEAIADALIEQSKQCSSSSGSSSESPLSSPQSSSSDSIQEKGLVALIVWNNNLTRNSGYHFSKTLSRCHSLEMLNMGQNPLCSEIVNRLKNGLQKNRSLLSLGMQSTRLGAEAAIALAEIIEDNPVIQRIDLRDNKLQAAGLLALATALKKNRTVTRIDLDDAPPNQIDKEQPLEEARLVMEIRTRCKENEIDQNPPLVSTDEEENILTQRRRISSFTTRKISLTCQTLHAASEPILSPPKVASRLRSPLPSPIPSPISSPIPSPAHRSRFQVSRVSDSSSGTSQSPSPSTPPGPRNFFSGSSRFRVVSVSDTPSISVQGPDESITKETSCVIDVPNKAEVVKLGSSRFSIVRNIELGNLSKTNTSDHQFRKDDDRIVSLDSKNNIEANNTPFLTDDNKVLVDSVNIATQCDSESKNLPIKKNKSESSLDSPDFEVSRLMQEKKNLYSSSSSLDISGSSMESLHNLETKPDTKESNVFIKESNLQALSVDSEEGDVFGGVEDKTIKRSGNLSLSSNESSLDLSAPVEVPQGNVYQFSNQPFLHSSVSSNDSVSPNIFGKHMKLHGSVTSLEASVSSLDSFKSGSNTMISPMTHNVEVFNFASPEQTKLMDSTDSGIFQSENSPKTINSSISSNEDTLTMNSSLTKIVQSLNSESQSQGNIDPSDNPLNISKTTSGLLDVPLSVSKQRNRKISWVPSPGFGSTSGGLKKETDDTQQRSTSNLEKLFNLFQIPTNIFSRSGNENNEKKESQQSLPRQSSQSQFPSTSGSFWPWSSNNTSPSKSSLEKVSSSASLPESSKESTNLGMTQSISAEYTVKLPNIKGSRESEDEEYSCGFVEQNEAFNEEDDSMMENVISSKKSDIKFESSSQDEFPTAIELDEILSDCNEAVVDKFSYGTHDDEIKIVHCDNLEDNKKDNVSAVSADVEALKGDRNANVTTSFACDSIPPDKKESHIDNVAELSVALPDSINDKDLVQSNLLSLGICDSDNYISDGMMMFGSQSGVECISANDEDMAKNIHTFEKDNTIPSAKKVDERLICRDLSVSSVTSSTNDTDTDNSPNTFDCHISPDSLFQSSGVILSNVDDKLFNKNDDDNIENIKINVVQSYTDTVPNDLIQVQCISDESHTEKVTESVSLVEEKNNLISKSHLDEFTKPTYITMPSAEITVNVSSEKLPSAVLKQSIGIENKAISPDRQSSPDSGPSVENLPSKIIKRIKENISPENTLTSSMSNTQALAQELAERRKIISINSQIFKESVDSTDIVFDLSKSKKQHSIDNENEDVENSTSKTDTLHPVDISGELIFRKENIESRPSPFHEPTITTVEPFDDGNSNSDSNFNDSIQIIHYDCEYPCLCTNNLTDTDNAATISNSNNCIHVIEDYKCEGSTDENLNPDTSSAAVEEAKDALTVSDLDENLRDDDNSEISALSWNDSFNTQRETNDIEDANNESFKRKNIGQPVSILKNPTARSSPKDIPHHFGSLPESSHSPKSLPDNLSARSKMKSRSPVSTLGNLARDSLYGLNVAEDDEIVGGVSLERVRSLGSVSEDAADDVFPLKRANSSSESRSLGAFTSQESLASLASISETAGEGGDDPK